jgi:DNA-binding response OmpR family regulator
MSTVLLVDDEKNVLKTLSLSLQRHDFSVMQAQNGPDALRLLDEASCDYVVSDIRMTPMNGYMLASAIRERHPRMPIIFMSAYAADPQEGHSRGIEDCPRLTKPFPVGDLIRLLQSNRGRKSAPAGNGKPARILLFDASPDAALKTALETAGYTVDRLAASGRRNPSKPYDLIVLDERVLDDGRWVLFNEIEQEMPAVPILLVAERDAVSCPGPSGDRPFTTIHRSVLLRHPERAKDALHGPGRRD